MWWRDTCKKICLDHSEFPIVRVSGSVLEPRARYELVILNDLYTRAADSRLLPGDAMENSSTQDERHWSAIVERPTIDSHLPRGRGGRTLELRNTLKPLRTLSDKPPRLFTAYHSQDSAKQLTGCRIFKAVNWVEGHAQQPSRMVYSSAPTSK